MQMTSTDRRKLATNFTKWVRVHFADPDSEMFLITFTFKEMNSSSRAKCLERMRVEIEGFSSRLITRLFRDPNAISADDRKFLMLLFPDLPVGKTSRPIKSFSNVNEGLHYAGAMIAPRKSRLRITLPDHIEQHASLYRPEGSPISTIHLEMVTHNPDKVMEYNMKHIRRQKFSFDDMLVLPKANAEARSVPSTWRKLLAANS